MKHYRKILIVEKTVLYIMLLGIVQGIIYQKMPQVVMLMLAIIGYKDEDMKKRHNVTEVFALVMLVNTGIIAYMLRNFSVGYIFILPALFIILIILSIMFNGLTRPQGTSEYALVSYSKLMPFALIFIIIAFASIYTVTGLQYTENQVEVSFADAVYFSSITLTNLGYGDIVPESTSSKYTVILETIVGYFLLGLYLGYIQRIVTLRFRENETSNENSYD